ncbi:unnamed protein product [Thelazia callipaeda]|uniref:NAD(P)-bd_dom domain-containing protein n=1 Tax=Thelazia callipaeda TaxID=103827 RepID=A0A158RCL6_THECL|nr:unnamed protein product [Thelazia callipaeda]
MVDEKSYLLVGGLTYLGLNMADYLLKKDSNIKLTILDLIDKENYTYVTQIAQKFKPPKFSMYRGSGANAELVKKVLTEQQISIVLYNAWNSSAELAAQRSDHPDCFRQTLSTLTQFLEVLRHYKSLSKFILISSEEVYGKQKPRTETTATKPGTLKGAAISACEAVLHSYFISYRIPMNIVRLSPVVYGNVMDDIILKQIGYDDVERLIPWSMIHMEDALDGINDCLKSGKLGEVYNIGGQIDCPNGLDIRGFIQKRIKNEPTEQINSPASIMSSLKAESVLQWKAKFHFFKGIYPVSYKMHNICRDVVSEILMPRKILIYGTKKILQYCSHFITTKEFRQSGLSDRGEFIISKHPFDSQHADTSEIIEVSPSDIIYINALHPSEGYFTCN